MNGPDPICVPQVVALIIGDRDQRQFAKNSVEWLQLRQIQTAVMGRHRAFGKVTHQGGMQKINVKVQHVEFARRLPDLLQHDNVVRYWVPD
jgi:hypothetical protein